jgi:hypothetical protein
MNYAELFLLEQELLKGGARDSASGSAAAGSHEWAPTAVWEEALGWFELLAMNDGRKPRDTAFAASAFAAVERAGRGRFASAASC